MRECVSRVAKFALNTASHEISTDPLVKARPMSFNLFRPVDRALSRRDLLQTGLTASMAGTGLGQAIAQSAQPALADVWIDVSRNRNIPVLIRWPNRTPLGVVIYSHGLGGKKEGGDVWGQAWASLGLVVVHLQHAGSDAEALKGGLSALRKAMQPEQLAARVSDVRFVVGELNRRRASGAAGWSAVPLDRLAVAGHSFGARSTLVAAGWQRAGFGSADPLPKAFIALSPALGAGVSLDQARKELAGVNRPFLICTGSLDGEVLNNGETPEARRMVFDALPAGNKYMLWLDQADHFTFAGNDKQIPSSFLARRSNESMTMERDHHERVARVSSAWLSEQLFGQGMGTVDSLAAKDQWLRG